MEFEDILLKVGEFGRYQKKLMLLFLFPAAAILAWYAMTIFFTMSVPDHWCHVPELVSSNLSIAEQQKLIRPPKDPRCFMYNVSYADILASSNWTVPEGVGIKPCDRGWEYDKTYFSSTAATKWNLVCADAHYVSLVFSTTEIGHIIGTPIYSGLSDKFGRRPVFSLTVVVMVVTATSSVLMPAFVAFLVLRIINGTIMPSIFQLPYIILLEVVGPKLRTRMNGIANSSWTVGICSLSLIAWLTRDWIVLNLSVCSTAPLFIIFWWILPESPRWLVSQERYDEAADRLVMVAKQNGKTPDRDDLLLDLKKLGEQAKEEKEQQSNKLSSWQIFKYPQLRKKFLIITGCWIADATSYYGLQLNVKNLGGNEFVNFFLVGLAELPGYLLSWYFMDKVGRRWCAVFTLCLTGLVCMVPAAIPEDNITGPIVLSFIAKVSSSAAFMIIYQQAAEIYPTVIRSLGMGLSGTISSIVATSVPYVVYLGGYGKFIPFLIIGFICIGAGISAAFLPETLNEVLPDTIEESEKFGMTQKFLSWNRRRRPSCYEKQEKARSSIEMKKRESKP